MESHDQGTSDDVTKSDLVARVLSTGEGMELKGLLDYLETQQWRLGEELRSRLEADDLQAHGQIRATASDLSDVMLAMAALSEDDTFAAGAVLWNLGGYLADADLHLEAANAYLRAGFKLREELALAPPGTNFGEAEDQEQWSEYAFFHACRNFVSAGYVIAAAAVIRIMNAQDLLEEAESLLNGKIGQ